MNKNRIITRFSHLGEHQTDEEVFQEYRGLVKKYGRDRVGYLPWTLAHYKKRLARFREKNKMKDGAENIVRLESWL